MTEPSHTEVDQFVWITHIIAAAIAAAVPIYVAVAWVVAPTSSMMAGDRHLITTMAVIFGAVSIGVLAAAHLLGASRMRSLAKLGDARQRLGGYRTTVIIAF